MRAVILAAGAGRRLEPMGWERPKCLLPCPFGGPLKNERTRVRHVAPPLVGGADVSPRHPQGVALQFFNGLPGMLLDNLLNTIASRGVGEVVMVVGYRRELIEQAVVGGSHLVRFVVNEAFATTNTLWSLWLAREHLIDGFLLFNGDVWFRPSVVDALLSFAGSALAIEEKSCGEEEVKVMVDGNGRILRVGKELNPGRCFGESVGIGRFDAAFARSLVESLDRVRAVPGSEKYFYEAAIDPLLERHSLTGVPIAPGDAIEIDTPEDYERAQRLWSA